MKYVVQIDDNDQENKSLIEYLRSLALAGRKIQVLTEDEILETEDRALLKLMEEGKDSALADTEEVLKFLKQSQ